MNPSQTLCRISRVQLDLLVIAVLATSSAAAQVSRSVWDGVYTGEQARRGKAAYAERCASCHGPELAGGHETPPVTGETFLAKWNNHTVQELFGNTRVSMPADRPGSLSRQTVSDILAYILESNGFPAGSEDLKTPALPKIRLTGKTGPGPVPDFALVQTVGCLTETADGWTLNRASEPMRSRNPDKPTDDEFKQAGNGYLSLLSNET